MTTYRMTIRNAPPGVLVLRDGTFIFKTEYSQTRSNDPQCYCLMSGEMYHGDGYDVDCLHVTDDLIEAVAEPWEAP